MCLIVLAWRPGHAQPLLVAANRDEFYARASQPLAEWPDVPGVFAGRDLEAGGTWLGVGPNGRFAALTNIRNPNLALGTRSRGELPLAFLAGDLSTLDFLQQLKAQSAHYSGFNLLLGDHQQLWHFNSLEQRATALPAGVHGISNADLNTPWPKLLRSKSALHSELQAPHPHRLLELLADPTQAADTELPQTGIGLSFERLLSSAFIASPTYGTRASTALIVNADGSRQIVERSFGINGVYLGEVALNC
ncbi:NRDE family protein [uncultured Pseudomonas sp.]|uniref:NRDE family protein n=1 Tax=uncultured Pseudomonas sp. TaxID=114707 RepID=UPI00260E661B|nr:NRDE family protein [uncultured Pseudomonas sp.]